MAAEGVGAPDEGGEGAGEIFAGLARGGHEVNADLWRVLVLAIADEDDDAIFGLGLHPEDAAAHAGEALAVGQFDVVVFNGAGEVAARGELAAEPREARLIVAVVGDDAFELGFGAGRREEFFKGQMDVGAVVFGEGLGDDDELGGVGGAEVLAQAGEEVGAVGEFGFVLGHRGVVGGG
jgi:hypothetical protein